jgi:hypothetical protein
LFLEELHVGALKLLAAVPFFLLSAWLFRRRQVLARRGVTVQATCVDRRWSGQGDKPTYVLRYEAGESGERFHINADEREVPSGTREGGRVDVCFDPGKPSRAMVAETVRAPLWKRGYEVASFSVGVAILVSLVLA